MEGITTEIARLWAVGVFTRGCFGRKNRRDCLKYWDDGRAEESVGRKANRSARSGEVELAGSSKESHSYVCTKSLSTIVQRELVQSRSVWSQLLQKECQLWRWITAIFHWLGTCDLAKDWLMRWGKMPEIAGAARRKNHAGNSSTPSAVWCNWFSNWKKSLYILRYELLTVVIGGI